MASFVSDCLSEMAEVVYQHDMHSTDYCFFLLVQPTAPSGHDVPVRITGNPRSGFRVDYTPVDVGKLYLSHPHPNPPPSPTASPTMFKIFFFIEVLYQNVCPEKNSPSVLYF